MVGSCQQAPIFLWVPKVTSLTQEAPLQLHFERNPGITFRILGALETADEDQVYISYL